MKPECAAPTTSLDPLADLALRAHAQGVEAGIRIGQAERAILLEGLLLISMTPCIETQPGGCMAIALEFLNRALQVEHTPLSPTDPDNGKASDVVINPHE